MTNAEIITVLRHCGKDQECSECPLHGKPSSECVKILLAAADALEAAEQRIARLEEERNKTVTEIFWEEQSWWENRCKELEAQNAELVTKCIQLEAQMPKRGEWIECDDFESAMKGKVVCSNCKEPQQSIEISNKYIRFKNQKTRYCPNCGARMRKGRRA